ncbi:MAG: hypothetical protein WA726_00440 [Acidimicrobiia bacterium]
MSNNNGERILELEESAQGTDLFRAPGAGLAMEQARDQAEASGWIPEREMAPFWPTRVDRIATRRSVLRMAMSDLEAALARPAHLGDWMPTVLLAMTDLGRVLADHVREIEAPDGLLAEILDEEPRLSAAIDDIRKDHVELRETWERANEMLAGEGGVDAHRVRRHLIGLLGRLTQHRQMGADLVYDAYNTTVFAAD